MSAHVEGSDRFQVGSGNVQTNVDVDAGTLPPPQTPGAGVVPHNLPPASGVFEGRDLTAVTELFDGGAGVVVGQAAVHGLGGIGKSELANHYARRFLDQYSLVWWITADSRQSVGLGLAALTKELHPVATLADAQAWALGWLQSHTGWLLVLDNVEDVADITELLGRVAGRGRVLVTTRRDLGIARWAKLGLVPLRLGVLSRAASVRLLMRLTASGDAEGAGRLAEALGDLPLALQQAAAYITQHTGTGFDEYRQLLAEEFDRAAADAGEGETSDRCVSAVWTVTMDAVSARRPLAVRVLRILAWLAPDDVPEPVLTALTDDPRDVGDALATLVSYSMISRERGGVSLHRLVQAVTRSAMIADGTAAAVHEQAVGLLAKAAPDDPINNVAGWPLWAALLPHVSASVEAQPSGDWSMLVLHILDRAATYQQFQGNITAAITAFEQVVAGERRMLGDDHAVTLTGRNNLALAYESAGRVDEAIVEFRDVLAGYSRILGEHHPSTLSCRNNLALAYRSAGRVDEAIAVFEQVVADRRRELGEDHPYTLNSWNNLAAAYQSAGRLQDSITSSTEALAALRRVLSEDHPYTMTARNNLAGAYQAAGWVDRAITEYEELLTRVRRVLGEDNPYTLTTRNNVAGAHRAAGRWDEAIAEYEQLRDDCGRALGGDHPISLTVRNNLALAYDDAGRVDEAIAILEHVLADVRRVLSEDHFDAISCRSNLAAAYRDAGRMDEAIAEYERVQTALGRVLGDHHARTLVAGSRLAAVYQSAGRLDEAITEYERVVPSLRQVQGEDHSDTLTSANNLAGAYLTAGRVDEAIAAFEQVLARSRRVLGEDHPNTQTTRNNLAAAYAAAGRTDEDAG